MSGIEITGGSFPPRDFHVLVKDTGRQVAQRAGREYHREVVRRIPRRTGMAARSITMQTKYIGRSWIVSVGSNLFYVPYLEYGTGLYGPRNEWIRPKAGKALKFPSAGRGNQTSDLASVFGPGGRTGATAAPGFRLTGQIRSGRRGNVAAFAYAARIRGMRPRRPFRDARAVAEGRMQREFASFGVLLYKRLLASRGIGL